MLDISTTNVCMAVIIGASRTCPGHVNATWYTNLDRHDSGRSPIAKRVAVRGIYFGKGTSVSPT